MSYRYYKPVSTLYKRPSTLCLPVACQPDPGVGGGCRRLRKIQPQRYYDTQTIYSPAIYNLNRRHSVAAAQPQQQIAKKRHEIHQQQHQQQLQHQNQQQLHQHLQQQQLEQQQQQQLEALEFEQYLANDENTRDKLVNKVFKYARGLRPKVSA